MKERGKDFRGHGPCGWRGGGQIEMPAEDVDANEVE